MTSVRSSAGETALAYPMTLVTSDGERLEFDCASDRNVLEAAAAAGAMLPASCRQGTCGSCCASIDDGEFELGTYSELALPQGRRESGHVLLCRTYPRGRLSGTLPYSGSKILYGAIPVREAVITSMETVARETVRLELSLEPDEETGLDCQFDPGQFVELQVPGHDAKRAYSLANTGNWEGRLEFFIRLRPGGLFSTYLQDHARIGERIIVHGPQGAFGLHETGLRPRWFVAGGTGLAPLLSMVRHMAEWQEPQPALLVLGVNEDQDAFGLSELEAVATELPGFSYETCVWRPGSPKQEPATPVDRVTAHLATATVKPDIYVCGPPPMVEALAQVAAAGGVTSEHFFCERFLPS